MILNRNMSQVQHVETKLNNVLMPQCAVSSVRV